MSDYEKTKREEMERDARKYMEGRIEFATRAMPYDEEYGLGICDRVAEDWRLMAELLEEAVRDRRLQRNIERNNTKAKKART